MRDGHQKWRKKEWKEECVVTERMMGEEMRGEVTPIGQFGVKRIATICCTILGFNERWKKEKGNRRIMCCDGRE